MNFSSNNIREPIVKASNLYAGRNDLIIAEVGVDKGDHAEVIFNLLKPERLILIDPWYGNDKLYEYVKNRFKNYENVYIFRNTSREFIKRHAWLDEFDLVYLDGDHTYDAIKYDLESWYDYITIGGILAGHDYNKERYNETRIKCGVKPAVDEFVNKNNLELNISNNDRDFWIIK